MNRLRAFALAATLGLHLFALWSLTRSTSEAVRATRVAPEHRRVDPVVSTRAPDDPLSNAGPSSSKQFPLGGQRKRERISDGEPSPAPRDEAWRQGYLSGRASERKRLEWQRRFRRKAFGDDIGALMELPIDTAWSRLETLAVGGDKVAAAALLQIASDCRKEAGDPLRPSVLNELISRVSPLDAAFLQGAYEAEAASMQALQAQCALDGETGLRRLVQERRGTPGDETGLRGWLEVWEAYRLSFDIEHAQVDAPTPMQDLASRMFAPDGTPSQGDIDALLAAVDRDPLAVDLLAQCFIDGCNGIDPLPPAERLSWSLRASRNGYVPAIADVIDQTRAHDPVSAYAWAGFERMLMMQGCGVAPSATMISHPMRTQFEIGVALTPAERTLGEQRARELVERYGDRAMNVLECAPVR